ncbi:NAD(P)-dependent alcohol dehydrogenase [Paramicrobacterium agarici]|uniref:L-iditol 2-dehydrogenase n=1 Tax=Paramicrobacterium agarici TaxID=630514 RepID=A0A2A9DZ51_9MICO|nr:NAD(P)-dependent alcohol dehydrogenase [Microbacterium agarici]PFG31968.1 L-iditol 2-dehydrogenase [Microbacterium agarici]TQO21859.1 L-iditol 2-dehydrogenase [Microbacterium agarici]
MSETGRMRASVLTAATSLEVQSREIPVPDADQVLVRIEAVGVCGSDVHFYKEGRLGDWVVDEPLILGHESAGVIVAVGSDVDANRVGERVSIEPQRPDPTSRESMAGQYNLDPAMEFYAVPGVDGAFAEYAVIQAHFAHTVPDSVSLEAAALLEPLSVAVATARKAGFTVGSRVLITGAGPIGIITAQVAKAYGAAEIIVTDLDAARREQALRFGATRVIDPSAESVGSLGLDVDAFVDASGAAPAVRSGFGEVRPGGAVVLVGMGASEIPLPVTTIQNNELIVTGIFRYANTWPTAIGLVERGEVDLDALVTGRFPLDEVQQALESTGRSDTLKSIVTPQR